MSLSIITPTLNRSTLQRTIESVKAQTIPVEHIIRYDIFKDGASKLRNKMIKEAKTTWVGFCDDDDWLDPHYHEWLKEYEKTADAVLFQMKRLDGMILPDHTQRENLTYNWVGISFAVRTSVAKRLPFKDMIGEDFDLIERLKKERLVIDSRVAYFVG